MSVDFSDAQLVIVQAPAGSGKTSLLRDLAGGSGLPVAWVDIVKADDDPLHLAREISLALAEICHPPLPPPTLADLRSLQMDWVPDLTNRLPDREPHCAVLVIDRLERLSNPAAAELLSSLLSSIGARLRVLIGTRTKPRLKLARRVASGEAVAVGPQQLELDEAAVRSAFERAGGVELSGAELAAVRLWSRGWHAAVNLAAEAWAAIEPDWEADEQQPERYDLERVLDEVTDGPLADYVEQSILSDLSEQERRLLPALAAIERVSQDLAGVLVDGQWNGQQAIQRLRDHRGLVITLDDNAGGWLAVRPAMRGPLVALLERSGVDGERSIRDRARDWFERQGMIEDAIEQAAAIADADTAGRLLREHGLSLLSGQRFGALQVALEAASEDAVPDGLAQALKLVIAASEGADARDLHLRAEAIWAEHSGSPAAAALVSVVLATPGGGDVKRAIGAARRAIDQLEAEHPLRCYLSSLLGLGLLLDGRTAEARLLLQPLIGGADNPSSSTIIFSVLALAAVDEGDAQLAERYAQAAVELCSEPGRFIPAEGALAYASLAESLRLAGKLVLAREMLEEARSLSAKGSLRYGMILVLDARLTLAERRRGVARLVAARAREVLSGFADPGDGMLSRLAAIDTALTQRVDDADPGSRPSPAELRVLAELFATGSRSEIARSLFLSEQTVKSHLRRLYRRLGVNSREEALTAARARGLGPSSTAGATES